MSQIEATCSKCGSGEYELLDAKTGEVACPYCHNMWIIPELRSQPEVPDRQPAAVFNQQTETDRQLMSLLSGLINLNPLRTVSKAISVVVIVIAAFTIVMAVLFFIKFFGISSMLF